MKRDIGLRVLGLGLDDQEDLLSRLKTPISHIVPPVMPIISAFLLSLPGPPSRAYIAVT